MAFTLLRYRKNIIDNTMLIELKRSAFTCERNQVYLVYSPAQGNETMSQNIL